MKFQSTLTKQEFLTGVRFGLRHGKSKKRRLIQDSILLILAFSMIAQALTDNQQSSGGKILTVIFYCIFFGLLFVMINFGAILTVKFQGKQNHEIDNPRTISLSEDGIESIRSDHSYFAKWSRYQNFTQIGTLILLKNNNNTFEMFFIKSLDENTLNQIKKILLSHMVNNKV